MPLIPARSFAMQRLKTGESIKIANTSGGQVIDTWAFSLVSASFPSYMSMVHTRSTLHKLLPRVSESFLDNRRAPILTVTQDTSPGRHDVLFAACSPERYVQLHAPADHDNCASNLYQAISSSGEPKLQKLQEFLGYGWMPDPLNLFMNVIVDGNGLFFEDPNCRPGDSITLKAAQDCMVVMSACPMDVSACNGGEPCAAEYDVIG